MENCCSLDCELVPDNDLCASVEDEEALNARTDNVIIVNREYTGVDTDDIAMNVDNENYTISATKKTYIHEQALASSIWQIQHNLDRYPSVTVVDSAGDVVVCNVKYIDRNNVRLDFHAEFGGKAYLN